MKTVTIIIVILPLISTDDDFTTGLSKSKSINSKSNSLKSKSINSKSNSSSSSKSESNSSSSSKSLSFRLAILQGIDSSALIQTVSSRTGLKEGSFYFTTSAGYYDDDDDDEYDVKDDDKKKKTVVLLSSNLPNGMKLYLKQYHHRVVIVERSRPDASSDIVYPDYNVYNDRQQQQQQQEIKNTSSGINMENCNNEEGELYSSSLKIRNSQQDIDSFL
jgi:hypothetical protein